MSETPTMMEGAKLLHEGVVTPDRKRRTMSVTYFEEDFTPGEPKHSEAEIREGVEKVNQILATAVRIGTGRDDLAPRPGQLELAKAITISAMLGGDVGKPNIAEAPTGLGKSFAALGPCGYMASLGQRSLIATESIGLQSQYIDKDAPVIAEAVEEVTGYRPQIAVLKGWSNYVCLASATSTAEQILGLIPGHKVSSERIIQELKDLSLSPVPYIVNGFSYPADEIVPLVIWALEQTDGGDGDKVRYHGKMTDNSWQTVSVSPAECVGKKCPMFEYCFPREAKERAGEADIVITNHSMIAVQASLGVKVVLGNSKIGDIDIVVVDEAHALPGNVRNQGKGAVSGARLISLGRSISRLLDSSEAVVREWMERAEPLARSLEAVLNPIVKLAKPGDVVRIGPEEQPLEDVYGMIDMWLSQGEALASRAKSSNSTAVLLNHKRFISRLDGMGAALDAIEEHQNGVARWVTAASEESISRGQPWTSAESSPVDVSKMLRYNIWENRVSNPENPEDDLVTPRTVVAMSATLPMGFGFQVGIAAKTIAYESPFEEAYKRSAVYIPMFSDDPDFAENWMHWNPSTQMIERPTEFDPEILGRTGRYKGGKASFDTHKHVNWVAAHMIELVRRNGGRALILSANRRAGERTYVPALRAALRGTGISVYSQWEGDSLESLKKRWCDDETAVLVGTRSLMTGVDAPGQTCSLVIYDRPPRAYSNPVDDTRVEDIMAQLGISKWDADRHVYVADAAMLKEQEEGRGIRQIDDQVLIAALDPRMLRWGPYTYQAQTRAAYVKSIKKYGEVVHHIEDAFDFIDEMRENHPYTPPVKKEPFRFDTSKLGKGTEPESSAEKVSIFDGLSEEEAQRKAREAAQEAIANVATLQAEADALAREAGI